MVPGQPAEEDVALALVPDGGDPGLLRERVVVRQLDALRGAGGAAGVEEERGILGTRLDGGLPGGLLQGAKGNAAGVVEQGTIIEHDDLFQPTRPRELVLLCRRPDDRDAGAGVVEAVVQDLGRIAGENGDRKSTRLNSSHLVISYAVFCLKKK